MTSRALQPFAERDTLVIKLLASLAAAGVVVLATSLALAEAPPASPAPGIALLSAPTIAKVREEIKLQENRAKELEPIIARDRQARRDVETNWVVLERHAKELHARAHEFRELGKVVGGKGQEELNGFATELDTYATHDEENARFQHELAERLEKAIAGENNAREWHAKHAARLREWLAANGA
jgi:hypothetical protein